MKELKDKLFELYFIYKKGLDNNALPHFSNNNDALVDPITKSPVLKRKSKLNDDGDTDGESKQDPPFADFLHFIQLHYMQMKDLFGVDVLDFFLANSDKSKQFICDYIEEYKTFSNKLIEDDMKKAKIDTMQDESVRLLEAYIDSPQNLEMVIKFANIYKNNGNITPPDTFEFWRQETSIYYLRQALSINERYKGCFFDTSSIPKTRFDRKSKSEIVSMFSAGNLACLDKEGIIELCQAMANIYSKEHNVAPCLVSNIDYDDTDGKTTMGAYFASSNKILISNRLIDRLLKGEDNLLALQLFQTVVHESHHNVQFFNISKDESTVGELDKFVSNMLLLHSNEDQKDFDFQEYLWQVEELDARYHALKEINIAKKNGFLNKDVAGYVGLLNRREKLNNYGSTAQILKNLINLRKKVCDNPKFLEVLSSKNLSRYTDPNSKAFNNIKRLLLLYEAGPVVEPEKQTPQLDTSTKINKNTQLLNDKNTKLKESITQINGI